MKIAVYAICKNEEKNVVDFLRCVMEADKIFMVDTGSTDTTIELAKTCSYVDIISAEFHPFAFDVARNMSLQGVIDDGTFDIAVVLDLDERLPEGWRKELEKVAAANPTATAFHFNMQLHNADGSEATYYRQLKAHRPNDYVWKYRAHEVLVNTGDNAKSANTEIVIRHHKDETKERSYLPMLAADFKAFPNDHRACFYYGRELYYAAQYPQALAVLEKSYDCKDGYFDAQQVEVLRTMFYCSCDDRYLIQALTLNRQSRECLYDWALHLRDNKLYHAAIGLVEMMFSIDKSDNFILFRDQGAWSWKPYDLLAECFWYTGNPLTSYENAVKAFNMNPSNSRLKSNVDFYLSQIKHEGEESED